MIGRIATGVPAPREVPLTSGSWPAGSPLYAPDPWAAGALEGLAEGDNLFLLGTGLTMVDIALRLIDLRPAARITAISRSGLVPQPHRWPGQRVVIDYRPPAPGTPLQRPAARVPRPPPQCRTSAAVTGAT